MIVLGPRSLHVAAAAVPVCALLAAWLDDWRPAVLLGVIAVGLVMGLDAFRSAPLGELLIERRSPAAVVVSTPGRIEWSVANTSGRHAKVAAGDSLPPSFGVPRTFGIEVPPGAVGHAGVTITPGRRGRFELDAIAVRTLGPWEIAGRQRTRSVPATLRVVPAFHSRREVELRLQRARLLDVGSRSVRAFGGGTEFDQLRDYSQDDQYRNIDWAATARAGRTIVRQYRAEQHETVVVALDNARLMAAKAGGITRLEHAMDAVMALASVTDRMGDLFSMLTFDAVPHAMVAGGRGHRHLGRLTDEMFDLEPVLGEADYAAMAADLIARVRRRSTVVVLTDLAPAVVEASLAPAVRALATRHHVVIGAVVASEIHAWVDAEPTDSTEAYRTAASAAAVGERRRAAQMLIAAGAAVVDAPAGRLGPQLVDHYLTKKAMGR